MDYLATFMLFDKHIFICINERAGNDRPSCGEAHGLELVAAFKKAINVRRLPLKIRAQKAGCLDVCNYGPTMVIYPKGTCYVGVSIYDVDEIVEEDIVNDRPVTRLLLETAKKNHKENS